MPRCEPLAARAGLSGQTTVVAPDAESVRAAAERDGVLIEASLTVPAESIFDLAIVEAHGEWSSALQRARSAVRLGGRLIVVAGEPRSWLGRLRGPSQPSPSDAEIVRAIEAAGWTTARAIGGRDDLRFVEAFRR